MNPLNYRKIAVESASPAGLVILMYDTLVGDIQRAVAAMHAGNIEERCQHMHHAFQVLQQLELFLDLQNGGDTAKSLLQFYDYLRAVLLEAQCKQSIALMEKQIALILEVREAWQTLDAAADRSLPSRPAYSAMAPEPTLSNWSA